MDEPRDTKVAQERKGQKMIETYSGRQAGVKNESHNREVEERQRSFSLTERNVTHVELFEEKNPSDKSTAFTVYRNSGMEGDCLLNDL